MSEFSIGNISGSGNVIGSNNTVVNKRLSNDLIIRDEAAKFTSETLESVWFYASGHIDFINQLQGQLVRYYTPESKSIFLDQVLISVNAYWEAFCKKNRNTDDFFDTYSKVIFFVEQERDQLPKVIKQPTVASAAVRTKVFISYSRKDAGYLDNLKRHFKTFEKLIDFWDDSKIEPGDKWKEKIEQEIQHAKVAILLISADFFNSDFIINNELPKLLQKANEDGAKIISVILKPCCFEEYPDINQYQAINAPNRPISSLDENAKEEIWVQLVREIKKSIVTG